MTTPSTPALGQLIQPLLDLVASSLLRRGADAKAARLFRELGPGAGILGLAGALGIPPGDQRAEVDRARRRAEASLGRAQKEGMTVVPSGSPRYPAWLSEIIDPPIVLWLLGDVSVLDRPGVAVVGSRRPSALGQTTAERLARDLARAGLVVTSGLARGIDGAAHRGALAVAGSTVAVLGSGLDVIYPQAHSALAREVAASGCLVSELPPGTPPLAHHFPLRNRLISGLSRAVVVVEAAERSGSLITARMALEQGRAVCAVPGSVVSGCHQGCHALIKDGARLVETVSDVLEELQWQPRLDAAGQSPRKTLSGNDLLDAMSVGEPTSVDRLADRTRLGAPALLAELGRLELVGLVRRLPGGWFARLD